MVSSAAPGVVKPAAAASSLNTVLSVGRPESLRVECPFVDVVGPDHLEMDAPPRPLPARLTSMVRMTQILPATRSLRSWCLG